MSDDTSKQGVLFKGLLRRPVLARFDGSRSSSDGGSVLLRAVDDRLGLSESLGSCLSDGRQGSKVRHSILDLLRQRMFAIACGYADGNDAARLSDDPAMKLLVGRDPVSGAALASQPTLSRFENSVRRRELLRMSEALADAVIGCQRRRRKGSRVRRITVDLDPTVDPTHGSQEKTLFSGYHRTWCYLPLAGFLTFDDEPEQHLFCCVLRPGRASDKLGCLDVLRRRLPRLRRAFPGARVRIRLDSGFSGPELFEFFEARRLEYVVGLAGNPVLARLAEPWMAQARDAFEAGGGEAGGGGSCRRFGEFRYRSGSWERERRVVVKAEVVSHFGREPKDNPRFVVTNLPDAPQRLYERAYCGRGDAENRIKELKHGLEIDRTSCTSFLANQFRVLLAAAACALLQELRHHARHTGCARAQIGTLQLRLLKLGAPPAVVGAARRPPPAPRRPVRRRLAPHRPLGRRRRHLTPEDALPSPPQTPVWSPARPEPAPAPPHAAQMPRRHPKKTQATIPTPVATQPALDPGTKALANPKTPTLHE